MRWTVLNWATAGVAAASCLFGPGEPALGQVDFNFTYQDEVEGTGFGFDDPTLGPDRQTALEDAAAKLGNMLQHDATIDIDVQESLDDSGADLLASAGQRYTTSPDGVRRGEVEREVLNDNGVLGEDANLTWNFGKDYHLGTSTNTDNKFDMRTVALHEFTHMLGFSTLIASDGSSRLKLDTNNDGEGDTDSGIYSFYDSLLADENGDPLIDSSGNFDGTADDLTDENGVFFTGPDAVAANGGNPVPIYSPSSYEDGSSLGHIDDSGSLMYFQIGRNANRSYSPVETAMLSDLGYTIPEPTTAALLALGGLTLVGRKRRPRAA
jgi:hypothetical protein